MIHTWKDYDYKFCKVTLYDGVVRYGNVRVHDNYLTFRDDPETKYAFVRVVSIEVHTSNVIFL